MAREKRVIDVGILTTSYGKVGETGRIVDADRRVFLNAASAAEEVQKYVEKELEQVWPDSYTTNELDQTARRFMVCFTFERKVVKQYGK